MSAVTEDGVGLSVGGGRLGEPTASDVRKGEHDRHLAGPGVAVASGIALRSCGPAWKPPARQRLNLRLRQRRRYAAETVALRESRKIWAPTLPICFVG
jgi:hypothetical protein